MLLSKVQCMIIKNWDLLSIKIDIYYEEWEASGLGLKTLLSKIPVLGDNFF